MEIGIILIQRLNSRLEAFFGFAFHFLAQVDRTVQCIIADIETP